MAHIKFGKARGVFLNVCKGWRRHCSSMLFFISPTYIYYITVCCLSPHFKKSIIHAFLARPSWAFCRSLFKCRNKLSPENCSLQKAAEEPAVEPVSPPLPPRPGLKSAALKHRIKRVHISPQSVSCVPSSTGLNRMPMMIFERGGNISGKKRTLQDGF